MSHPAPPKAPRDTGACGSHLLWGPRTSPRHTTRADRTGREMCWIGLFQCSVRGGGGLTGSASYLTFKSKLMEQTRARLVWSSPWIHSLGLRSSGVTSSHPARAHARARAHTHSKRAVFGPTSCEMPAPGVWLQARGSWYRLERGTHCILCSE